MPDEMEEENRLLEEAYNKAYPTLQIEFKKINCLKIVDEMGRVWQYNGEVSPILSEDGRTLELYCIEDK